MHPVGDEVVLCTAGRMTLHQQHADGTTATVEIGPSGYVINPPGCSHTADVNGAATALFIAAGFGGRTPGAVTQPPPRHASTGNTYNISAL